MASHSRPSTPADQEAIGNTALCCVMVWHSQCCVCCRSQQLAELLDQPLDDMTDDPTTPKGQQTAYNGVYILQQPKEEGPKKSRFGTRDQVGTVCVDMHNAADKSALRLQRIM